MRRNYEWLLLLWRLTLALEWGLSFIVLFSEQIMFEVVSWLERALFIQRLLRGFGLISDILGPGVGRDGPGAVSLNVKICDSPDDSEEPTFAPVNSPGVSYDPVLGSIFFSPSKHWYLMIKVFFSSGVNENATSVIDEFICSSDSARNGSALVDFVHHAVLAWNVAVLFDCVDFCFFLSITPFPWHTIFALDLSSASKSVRVPQSLIRWTTFISDVIFMYPWVSNARITAVASSVIHVAWKKDLRADDYVRPLSFSHYFYSVAHATGSWKGPTGTAVNWDVLVSLNGEVIDSSDISPPKIGWDLGRIELWKWIFDEWFAVLAPLEASMPLSGIGSLHYKEQAVKDQDEDKRLAVHCAMIKNDKR